MDDGATGELVLTHLQHRAAPLLRFRTRDHVEMWTSPCNCGRTAPRVRCIGRTDDMLIVRGVNVFPSAIREVVSEFAPQVSGAHPGEAAGGRASSRSRRLPVAVELARGGRPTPRSPRRSATNSRACWSSPHASSWCLRSLPRSEYKSKLVEH